MDKLLLEIPASEPDAARVPVRLGQRKENIPEPVSGGKVGTGGSEKPAVDSTELKTQKVSEAEYHTRSTEAIQRFVKGSDWYYPEQKEVTSSNPDQLATRDNGESWRSREIGDEEAKLYGRIVETIIVIEMAAVVENDIRSLSQ